MSIASSGSQADPAGIDARRSLIACVAVVLVSVLCQTILYDVNTDMSWIISMSERVLGGDRLYVDLIEVNPPMTLWMYLPAVALANAIGVSPEIAVYAYTYALCLLGVGLAVYVGAKAQFLENRQLVGLLPVFLGIILLLPQREFTQREQIGTAMLAPLLVLMLWRARNPVSNQPPPSAYILAGLSGSVLLLVKPYYAVTILAPALYVAWRRRDVKALFYPEYWIIAAVCIIYLLCVVTLEPGFLDTVYPLLSETYMQVGHPILSIDIYGRNLLILYAAYLVARMGNASPFSNILILASIASLGPMLYQGKGWPYHAYPAFALGMAATAYALIDNKRLPAFVSVAIMIVCSVAVGSHFVRGRNTDSGLIRIVREASDKPSVGVIGGGIHIGHPFTRMIGGHWIDLYCSDWAADAAIVVSERKKSEGDFSQAAYLGRLADDLVQQRALRLTAQPPDILAIQKHNERVTSRILGAPLMNGFMSQYRKLGEDDLRTVYQHIRAPGSY